MNVGNILGSVLGLGPVLGAGIYQLRKNRGERDNLRQIQESGGAGARIAERTARDAQRTAVGTAAGIGGQSGGLNLLQGLRSAERATAEGGQRAAIIGAQESAAATRQLHNDELARRAGIMELAGATANIIPTTAAQVLASKDSAPQNAEAARLSPDDVAANPAALGQFFDENPIPEFDFNDAQDAATEQEAVAQEPAAEQPAAQPAEEQSGIATPEQAAQVTEAMQLQDAIGRARNSEEFKSLQALGINDYDALTTVLEDQDPAMAALRERMLSGAQ